MVNQWEYMLLAGKGLDAEQLLDKLNELGSEGWEVVAHVGYEVVDSIVLKRPRAAEGEAARAEGRSFRGVDLAPARYSSEV